MLRLLILTLTLSFAAPIASAKVDRQSDAEALVQTTVETLSESATDQVADIVFESLDVAAIARFTLGRHAGRLSETQRSAYTVAFSEFLQRQISDQANRLTTIDLNRIDAIERNPRDAIVTTQLTENGNQVTLRWRVIRRGDTWSVVDLEFAGVWLAIEQRAQIAALLDRPGASIDDVIAQLG